MVYEDDGVMEWRGGVKVPQEIVNVECEFKTQLENNERPRETKDRDRCLCIEGLLAALTLLTQPVR